MKTLFAVGEYLLGACMVLVSFLSFAMAMLGGITELRRYLRLHNM